MDLNSTATTDVTEIQTTSDLIVNLQVFEVALLASLAFIGTVFNMVFFIALCNSSTGDPLRVTTRNLAFADVCVSLLTAGTQGVMHQVSHTWKGSESFCFILVVARSFGLYASSYIISFIAYYCYCAISFRRQSRRHSRTVLYMCVAIGWSFAFVAAMLHSVTFLSEEQPEHSEFMRCVTQSPITAKQIVPTIGLTSLAVLYMVPNILIVILQSFTFKNLSDNELYEDEARLGPGGRNIIEILERHYDAALFYKLEKDVMFALGLVLSTFNLCWGPYFATALWYKYDPEGLLQVNPFLRSIIVHSPLINSVLNPVVYGHLYYKIWRYTSSRRWMQQEMEMHTEPCDHPLPQEEPEVQAAEQEEPAPQEEASLEEQNPRVEESTV